MPTASPKELSRFPPHYLKKLVSTDDIWEVRVSARNNIFRLLAFFDGQKLIVLDHAFQKKTQKKPKRDIEAGHKNSRGQEEGLFQEENGHWFRSYSQYLFDIFIYTCIKSC
jgi:hypothetical protein